MSASTTPPETDKAAVVAWVLGATSVVGIVFPPLFGAGLAAVILGWTARKRIARSGGQLRGKTIAIIAIVLGILGCLVSLVLPGFIVSVWIYALFHGGQLPSGA